ncbi:MAG: hypothetical protein H0V07_07865 [Propionibacteriales bacterium]|nr:hypothetical protein [Propionibacteriales bacterium]
MQSVVDAMLKQGSASRSVVQAYRVLSPSLRQAVRRDVHPKVVSEALGHSSAAFTMDTYQHLVPSMQRAAAEAIEAELG